MQLDRRDTGSCKQLRPAQQKAALVKQQSKHQCTNQAAEPGPAPLCSHMTLSSTWACLDAKRTRNARMSSLCRAVVCPLKWSKVPGYRYFVTVSKFGIHVSWPQESGRIHKPIGSLLKVERKRIPPLLLLDLRLQLKPKRAVANLPLL